MKITSGSKGFTLIELLISMTVFIIVVMITAGAFNTVLKQSAKLFRSEESNIEGLVGLEMMRHDLQQVGYGLFTETMATSYTGEAAIAPASTYNEASFTAPPRAVVIGNDVVAAVDNSSETGINYSLLAGTDYLALKATSVGRSKAAYKWSYLMRDPSGTVVPVSWASNDENFANNEKVMFLKRKISTNENSLTVEREPSSSAFYFTFSNSAFNSYSTSFNQFVIYGLDGATSSPRMPYNRTDYFVARPSAAGMVPGVCAPNTGILYKASVNNTGATLTNGVATGELSYLPVLDCVADMQVVLMWDLRAGTNVGQDGSVDTYSNSAGLGITGPGTTAEITAALADPALLRNSLKGIKVYILAQNGRLDPGYTSPSPIHVGDQDVATNTRGRNVDVAANGWEHYRWKQYQIIVRPKNLTSNQ